LKQLRRDYSTLAPPIVVEALEASAMRFTRLLRLSLPLTIMTAIAVALVVFFLSGRADDGSMVRRPGLDPARGTREDHPPIQAEPSEVQVPLPAGALGGEVYPAIGDLDGDGTPDLLVGGRNGRVLYYANVGTLDQPAFGPPTWFDEVCPDGRIPTG
jgi:hypothetical protein